MNKKRILIGGIFIILILIVLAVIIGCVIFKRDYSSQWYDIVTLVVSNVTILGIFIITYLLIDRNSVKKEENKYKIAKYLIDSAYKNIEEVMGVYTPAVIVRFVLPKVDGNKLIKDNLVISRIEEFPFRFEDHLFDLAKEGVLSETEFNNYVRLKQLYVMFIEMAITFPDEWQQVEPHKKELEEYIKAYKKNNIQNNSNEKKGRKFVDER